MTKAKTFRSFRGWIVADKHRLHLLGSVVGLRNSAHVFEKGEKIVKETNLERSVYIGCVHGGDEIIYRRLKEVAQSKPDYVIFTGDLTGSPKLEDLKSGFYRRKENGEYKEFEYFGHWAATLPRAARRKLLVSINLSVAKLTNAIQSIQKHGSKVILLEGNWDNPAISAVKLIAGNDLKKYVVVEKQFTDNGLYFINHPYAFETKATVHILLPYISLLHFNDIRSDSLRDIAKIVDEAKKAGKTIVMVGHAEANWKIHHLGANSPCTGERAIVISNFGRTISLFAPHEVIYPHQHTRMHDEKGNSVDVDAKYILTADRTGSEMRLVNRADNEGISREEVIATYLPFGYIAEEDFLV